MNERRIDIDEALSALDHMDDFARMAYIDHMDDFDRMEYIDQIGPRNILLKFIEQVRNDRMRLADKVCDPCGHVTIRHNANDVEVENLKDWICHNGGLLNEWAKEWDPAKHPTLTRFIRGRLDAALEATANQSINGTQSASNTASSNVWSDDEWRDFAQRHATQNWNGDGYLEAIKSATLDFLSRYSGSVKVEDTPWYPWLERRYGSELSKRIIRETIEATIPALDKRKQ